MLSLSAEMSLAQLAAAGSKGLQLGYGPGLVSRPALARCGRSSSKLAGVQKAPGTRRMTGRFEELIVVVMLQLSVGSNSGDFLTVG